MMLFEDVDVIERFLLSVCLEGSISETSPERSAYICLFLPLAVSLPPSVGHTPALRSAAQKCPGDQRSLLQREPEVQEKEMAMLMVYYVGLNEELPHD